MRKRRLESAKETLRERLAEGGLDEVRELIESLAQDFDILDVAAAAVAFDKDGRRRATPAAAPDAKPIAGRARAHDAAEAQRRQGRQRRPPTWSAPSPARPGVPSRVIGAIKIHDDYSLVEVPAELSERIISAAPHQDPRQKVTVQAKPSRLDGTTAARRSIQGAR